MAYSPSDEFDQDSDEIPEYVFIGTNFHNHPPRPYSSQFTAGEHLKTYPENVTLGFRNNFWRVFSSVTEYGRGDFVFEWLGRKWQFHSLWVSESEEVDFASYLDDQTNVFVIFVLKPYEQENYRSIRNLSFENKLNEQTTLKTLFEAFAGQPFAEHLNSFKHNRGLNALFTWATPATSVSVGNVIAFFSFYAFSLLMTWKIGRDQTHISLSIEQKDYRKQLRTVLRIRSQIINVERYFLTKNISNDGETKKIAGTIRRKFGIQRKMDGFLPLNESIERHLSTAAQLRADEKSTTLNVIAFLMALIGLPVSLMSMLLTISHNSEIIKDGTNAITHQPIAAFILSTVLFTLLLIAVAASVSYAIIKAVRKIW